MLPCLQIPDGNGTFSFLDADLGIAPKTDSCSANKEPFSVWRSHFQWHSDAACLTRRFSLTGGAALTVDGT